jgi:hypothetical protein
MPDSRRVVRTESDKVKRFAVCHSKGDPVLVGEPVKDEDLDGGESEKYNWAN